jgi:predicted nuclease of predicted toxin-antitoxin system
VKFLVDMPLSPGLAQWLWDQITADLDYPRLLALSTSDRPAIILFRGGDWSESQAVERLRAVLAAIDENDLSKSLVVVEHARIRRRALPLR